MLDLKLIDLLFYNITMSICLLANMKFAIYNFYIKQKTEYSKFQSKIVQLKIKKCIYLKTFHLY